MIFVCMTNEKRLQCSVRMDQVFIFKETAFGQLLIKANERKNFQAFFQISLYQRTLPLTPYRNL